MRVIRPLLPVPVEVDDARRLVDMHDPHHRPLPLGQPADEPAVHAVQVDVVPAVALADPEEALPVGQRTGQRAPRRGGADPLDEGGLGLFEDDPGFAGGGVRGEQVEGLIAPQHPEEEELRTVGQPTHRAEELVLITDIDCHGRAARNVDDVQLLARIRVARLGEGGELDFFGLLQPMEDRDTGHAAGVDFHDRRAGSVRCP